MVQLLYDGYDRLVEPYRLEYYVRKKDGRGLEYFWGWDTTGGKSGARRGSSNSSATKSFLSANRVNRSILVLKSSFEGKGLNVAPRRFVRTATGFGVAL
jgi:hypothetical protein